MARVVNEQEFIAHRNEILNVTKKLIYTKGYEQMSIKDILDELKMSKGAFYHYFDSKTVLLEASIEHLIDEAEELSKPILQDPNLTPLEKISKWFDASAQWKSAQRDYLMAIMRVWYADENAIIRQKMFSMEIKRFAPIFGKVIQEGISQGDLNTIYPEEASEMIFYLFQGMGDKFAELLIAYEKQTNATVREDMMCSMENFVAAYTNSFELVLGIPKGTLKMIDIKTVRDWFAQLSQK